MRKKTSKKTARATFGRGQGRATRGLFRRCRALRLSALPRYALVFRASVHPGSRGAATFQCVGRPERLDARTDSGHERRLHQRRQRVRSAAPHRGAGIDQSHHADPRQRALSKMSYRPGIGQISRLRTVVLAHLLAQPQSHRTPVEIRQEGLFVLDLLQRLCALQTGHLILSRSNSNHTQGRPRHLAFPPLPDLQKIKNYATVEYSIAGAGGSEPVKAKDQIARTEAQRVRDALLLVAFGEPDDDERAVFLGRRAKGLLTQEQKESLRKGVSKLSKPFEILMSFDGENPELFESVAELMQGAFLI